jgi:hypothetical protein
MPGNNGGDPLVVTADGVFVFAAPGKQHHNPASRIRKARQRYI